MKKTIYYILLVLATGCFVGYFVSNQKNHSFNPVFEISGFVLLFTAIIILRTDKTNTLRITDKEKAMAEGKTFIEPPKKGSYTLFKLSLLTGFPALVLMAFHLSGSAQTLNGLIADSITLKVLLPVFSIALLAAWANIIMGMRIVKGNSVPNASATQNTSRNIKRLFFFWLSILAGLSGLGLLVLWCPHTVVLISLFLPLLTISLVIAWFDIIWMGRTAKPKLQ